MKVLFIGGTGTISSAVSALAAKKGFDVYLLNRGHNSGFVPDGAKVITADINDESAVRQSLGSLKFDIVADFIAFAPAQVERDIRLFKGKTGQYIFISSASAYQKPLSHYVITESTPLRNPYWDYSRNKIACEDLLLSYYRNENFPITIIRPSHTYSERKLPVAIHGEKGSWQVVDRILKGKPVLVPGDGSSLWVLTFNTDFAKAFVGLMGNPRAIGEAFQITSEEALTWDAIYDRIGDAFGVKVKKAHVSTDFLVKCNPEYEGPLTGDKSNTVCFDISKIKNFVPDYQPEVTFAQGARKCAEYLLSHKEQQVTDAAFDNFCDRIIEAQEKAVEYFKNH